jgi:hypothetical protein
MMRRFDPARLGTLARWTGPERSADAGPGWHTIEMWFPPAIVTVQVDALGREDAIRAAGEIAKRLGLRGEPVPPVHAWRTAPPEPAA